jgi:hypothetical protein
MAELEYYSGNLPIGTKVSQQKFYQNGWIFSLYLNQTSSKWVKNITTVSPFSEHALKLYLKVEPSTFLTLVEYYWCWWLT